MLTNNISKAVLIKEAINTLSINDSLAISLLTCFSNLVKYLYMDSIN